jgi:hypothetical protein
MCGYKFEQLFVVILLLAGSAIWVKLSGAALIPL